MWFVSENFSVNELNLIFHCGRVSIYPPKNPYLIKIDKQIDRYDLIFLLIGSNKVIELSMIHTDSYA